MSRAKSYLRRLLKSLDVMFLIFIFAPVLILIIGVSVPLLMSNNLDKYQGDERVAAESVLKHTNEFYSHGIEMVSGFGVFNRQIEEVIKRDRPGAGAFSKCRVLYEVRIADLYWFGLKDVDAQGRYECIN